MFALIPIGMTLVINKILTVKSPSFSDNDFIPAKYTCQGTGINPELNITNIPTEAKSLALIVEGPETQSETFDHWVMWDIPPQKKIYENSAPGPEGLNGKKENKYYAPCPPNGTHRYHFKIYALDKILNLRVSTDK